MLGKIANDLFCPLAGPSMDGNLFNPSCFHFLDPLYQLLGSAGKCGFFDHLLGNNGGVLGLEIMDIAGVEIKVTGFKGVPEDPQLVQASGQRNQEVLERHLVSHVDEAQSGLLLPEPADYLLDDRRLADAAVAIETDVLAFEQVALDRVEDVLAATKAVGGGWSDDLSFCSMSCSVSMMFPPGSVKQPESHRGRRYALHSRFWGVGGMEGVGRGLKPLA